MQMFYAAGPAKGFERPEEGVFMSIQEFAPYRALGWSATGEYNVLADAYLLALGAQELSVERPGD